MPNNILNSAVNWLRAGYPDGVPPKDVLPLVALLTRSLTPQEAQEICRLVIRKNTGGEITYDEVVAAIDTVKAAPPSPEDVNDIAARLAAVGWPLSVPEQKRPAGGDDSAGPLQRILAWLRAGYPDGVPPMDYIPVLAVLEHRLSDEDVKSVAKELMRSRSTDAPESAAPISEDEVERLLVEVTQSRAKPEDVARVAVRLARKGWPLSGGLGEAARAHE